MATRDRKPVVTHGPLTGEFDGVCVSAERQTSKAGNAMVVFGFELDNGVQLRRWCLLRSTDIHETVTALGLDPGAVRLSEAPGRRCRLTIGHDGMFSTIEKTVAL